jgi:adenosylhomocysteinase
MEKDKALLYPVVAINDLKTKHLFDNYLGTGQSTIDGILRASSILIAGKTFVVVGYGNCGKGVAARAKGLGANVVVCETNAIKALQAVHDGCLVMPMMQAAKIGDVFVTVTGNKHVIRKEHFNIMKNNAILANSGHFDIEIDVAGLKEMTASVERIRNQFDCYKLKTGKKIYLCGEGRLVNLAAAEGHPSIVMAQSFCGQALACEFLVENKGKLKGVVNLPASIDNKIAELQLEALGIKKDYLTGEQKKYLGSWKEGT